MTSNITVEAAAKLLHVSKQTVYRRIQDGTFTCRKDFAGRMYIPEEEINEVLQGLREAGF